MSIIRPRSNIRHDVVVFGGGDILTTYFMERIHDGIRKHAISVGIPYESY